MSAAIPPTERLNTHLSEFTAESGGMQIVDAVKLEDVLPLRLKAALGDRGAAQTMSLVQQALASIAAAPRNEPTLCATCDAVLIEVEFSIIVTRPGCDNPAKGLAIGVCKSCAPDRDALDRKALEGLRKIWPKLREIQVTHSGSGRA